MKRRLSSFAGSGAVAIKVFNAKPKEKENARNAQKRKKKVNPRSKGHVEISVSKGPRIAQKCKTIEKIK